MPTTPFGQKRVNVSRDSQVASIVETTLKREGVTAMDPDYFHRWLSLYNQILREMTEQRGCNGRITETLPPRSD